MKSKPVEHFLIGFHFGFWIRHPELDNGTVFIAPMSVIMKGFLDFCPEVVIADPL